jgi:hypothetical protein
MKSKSASRRKNGPNAERAAAIRKSFARQAFMAHLGARIVRIGAGTTEICLPRREELLQQHGFFTAAPLPRWPTWREAMPGFR